ncbi:UDP-glycosyltransferase 83A1 isoform X2 [Hevea brasiliensis]|uniref:UDP-glycosyltransferase 83A1 isoform X2 n=1 Tax=Hevea brasiliensis TaxID=3981 RepID=UPI0025E9B454|nr:UDP-glycosyltransferase 83A1 isoform X2 [Hevea brasiliensis]
MQASVHFSIMGRKPHVVVVPYPAQGHVAPLMKLAYNLADHGVKVTFVNTESTHVKVMSAMPEKFKEESPISLVSVPVELDGTDAKEFVESAPSFMPAGWALEAAKKMDIKPAAFVPFGVANLALVLHNQMLIEAGIIDVDGIQMKDERICLSKKIPAWNKNELLWSFPGNPDTEKFMFQHFVRKIAENVKICNWLLANSFYELEPSACNLIPNILPIGPLFASDHLGTYAGNFWAEDSTSLSWLDQQPPRSVIYAAFGSTFVCDQQQFNELALGLEMVGQPFLWVVRSDFTNGMVVEFPDGFTKRVEKYGKIVKWAPQEKALAHPSTACFFSHCGWNSTMEGLSKGMPFLCWPYFTDQFHNRSYICETWKVGLRLIPDDNGIVTRHEIKTKLEKLLSDKDIEANSLKLKEMARKSTSEGGSSFSNFISFVERIKQ